MLSYTHRINNYPYKEGKMKERIPDVGRQNNRMVRFDDWLFQEDDFLAGKVPYGQEDDLWEDEE